MHRNDMTLGELISFFYNEYLQEYGDEDLASVAAAAPSPLFFPGQSDTV